MSSLKLRTATAGTLRRSVRERMRELRAKVQFLGHPAGLLLNPYYFARKGLCDGIRGVAGRLEGRLLDVGCGRKPYEALFSCSEYVGLELDSEENRRSKSADFFYDGSSFPFRDGEFDAVFASQVLEHVFEPERTLREIHRVLREKGTLLLTVPFIWDEHEKPVDFARYTSFGLRYLLEKNGFDVVESRKCTEGIRALAQLWNAYLFKVLCGSRPPRKWRKAFSAIAAIPANLAGAPLSWVLPSNADIYLDNIVLATRR